MNPRARRLRQRRRDTRNRIGRLASAPISRDGYTIALPSHVTWAAWREDTLIWGASRIPASVVRARRWPWSIDRHPLTDAAKSQLVAFVGPNLSRGITEPKHPTWAERYERRLEP